MLVDVLTLAALAFFGGRLAVNAGRAARSTDARQRTLVIARGLRLHHLLLAPLVMTGVLITAGVLYQIKPLQFGWWTALGGTGNIITGSTTRTHGTTLEWIVPAFFLSLVFPLLPLFAAREEEMFRLGAENWSTGHRIRRGLEFGLIHLIMGIPIAVALALSVGGWYFTWAYLRGYRRTGSQWEAMMESTRSHLAYNLEIITIAIVVLILTGGLT
jgi:hypothetical protein